MEKAVHTPIWVGGISVGMEAPNNHQVCMACGQTWPCTQSFNTRVSSEIIDSVQKGQWEPASDFVKVVKKNWGEERWIVNTSAYCGKMMILNKGWRCSIHYHKVKDETFLVTKGMIMVELYRSPDYFDAPMSKTFMIPGGILRVKPGTPHRFTGLEDSEFYEFSTSHDDADSHRLTESGKDPAADQY